MESFKRRLGQTILTLNEEILELQRKYRILGESRSDPASMESLEISTQAMETKVKEKKKSLEDAYLYLVKNPGLMEERKMNKYLRYTKTTINSAKNCLDLKTDVDDHIGDILNKTTTELKETIDEDSDEFKSIEDITSKLLEVKPNEKALN